MRKSKAMKALLTVAATAFFVSIPTAIVTAGASPEEEGIAGIAYSLDNYYSSLQGDDIIEADQKLVNKLKTIISPYKNLGVSVADSYVNIRKEPSIDSEVVGKLYRGCATDILEYLEGDWVKIESGDVKGYIASNYLAIGPEAEELVDEYATVTVTVNTETLNVREKPTTESSKLTLIPRGETYIVTKEYDEWYEILLGTDEETGNDFTGFVSKDYVIVDVEFEYAISIEEENRIRKEQEEAERAEAERKAKLAAEKAAKEAEKKRLAEEKRKAEQNKKNSESSKSNNNTQTSSGSKSSSSGNEIATYALKFVGNPYVWGGESLTHGADCSGFTQTIYSHFGYSIPRVSRDQAKYGQKVSESNLQPGDLIFYTNSGGTVNHVAMYIGNGKIVHAANRRQGIITSKYNYRSIYCIRRVI